MSELIPLTQGRFAIVDADNYDWLMQWKWHFNTLYARRWVYPNEKPIVEWMHRVILNTPHGMYTDHINGNGLDNRRCNLRICTLKQNQGNRKKGDRTTSKYKGVCWATDGSIWQSNISIKGKDVHLGRFKSEIDAAKAYDNAAKEYFGEFAKCNLI